MEPESAWDLGRVWTNLRKAGRGETLGSTGFAYDGNMVRAKQMLEWIFPELFPKHSWYVHDPFKESGDVGMVLKILDNQAPLPVFDKTWKINGINYLLGIRNPDLQKKAVEGIAYSQSPGCNFVK